MGISNAIANNSAINQFAGAHGVLTAAVVNSNSVQTSERGSLYPYFGFSNAGLGDAPPAAVSGLSNDTAVNQFAGPQSRLTAAVANTNDVQAGERNSLATPGAFPGFAPAGEGGMAVGTGLRNDTSINQVAGPQSVLTAAAVNTNNVQAGATPGPFPGFAPAGEGFMSIGTGLRNDTSISQFSGPQSVLTAAVANTNNIQAGVAPGPFPGFALAGEGPMAAGSGLRNDTSINQFAGPQSVLTAAVVNNNNVNASFPWLGLAQ